MEKTDRLVELVESLSPAEKRYFRTYSQRNDPESIYLEIFNSIAKSGKYDLKKIGRKLNISQAKQRNEAFYRNFLYNAILKSLRTQHAEHSRYLRILNGMAESELLKEKALYQQADKRLSATLKEAQRFGYDVLQLQILLSQRGVSRVKQDVQSFSRMDELQEKTARRLKELHEYNRLLEVYDRLYLLDRNALLHNDLEEKAFKAFEKRVNGVEEGKLSRFGKMLLAHCQLLALKIRGKKPAYHIYRGMISLYEEDELFLQENMNNYIGLLNNWMVFAFLADDMTPFEEGIPKLEAVKPRNARIRARQFEVLYNLKLLKVMGLQTYEEGFELVPEIERGLAEFDSQISPQARQVFIQNIAFLFFHGGDLPNSRRWLNRLLNTPKQDVRQDLRLSAQLLEIFLYVEEGGMKMPQTVDLIVHKARAITQMHKRVETPSHALEIANSLCKIMLQACYSPTHSPDSLYRELHETLTANHDKKVSWLREFVLWTERKLA